MKNFFYNLFKSSFKHHIDAEYQLAVQKERDSVHERKREFTKAELQLFVGKPVISISNEWDNPIIGEGLEIIEITKSKNPKLVIRDFLTGDEVFPMGGHIFIYTEQRFNAIMKLDPFELCSLLYSNTFFDNTFEKVKSGKRDNKNVILQKLTDEGFFSLVDNMKSEN